MKILILNCGSSSVKYALFDMPDRLKLCHGIVDMVTAGSSSVEHVRLNSPKYVRDYECPGHDSAIRLIMDLLTDRETGVIKRLSEIKAIGHRVVHGGERFVKPVVIDNDVMKGIEEYASLAPLHNPANLMGQRQHRWKN